MQSGTPKAPSNPPAPRSLGGISTMGVSTLIAVAAVVIVITLSSLRGMAIAENQIHAKGLLAAISKSINSEVFAAPPTSIEQVAKADQSLQPNLTDGKFLSDNGRLFLRHGYLFEWRESGNNEAAPFLVAWPFHLGQTGKLAFGLTPGGELITSPNQESSWSGLDRRPSQDWPTE